MLQLDKLTPLTLNAWFENFEEVMAAFASFSDSFIGKIN